MTEEAQRHYKTKPADKVSLPQKWLYSAATVALIPGMQIIDRIALVVLNMGLGIGPVLSSVTMAVFRIWDAFTDPFFGNLSDNYRSKWGRRRPFIVLGGIICAITFPLMWMMSREWTPMLTIIYFIGVGLTYYTGLTIYSVPYFSLACEMTPDTHERTNVLGFRQIIINIVTVGMGWLLWFITLDCFCDELEGTRWLAGITALLFLTFGIIPMLYVKEPFYARAEKQERIPFWASCKVTLTNGVAMLLVTKMLLMTIAMQSVGTVGFYVSTYYVLGGDKSKAGEIAGWGGTAMMFLSTITIPLFTWLSRRIGKIPTLYICGVSYLLSTLSQWWLLTPDHPYWQIISAAMIGPAVTGTWLILPSMQADVVDYDELKTGCRREGSYTAILGWIQKLGFSLAAILAGVILKISGFDVALEGAQSVETLTRMRMLYVFFPIVMAGVMLLLIRFYPLTEQRCHEIRVELEKRRGELHGTRKTGETE